MSLKKMKKEYNRGRKDFDPVKIHVSVEDAWRDDSPEPENNKWFVNGEPATIRFLGADPFTTNPFGPYMYVDVETYTPARRNSVWVSPHWSSNEEE